MKTKAELKKYKEIWNKIKSLIELENDGLDKYDNKFMKIIFISDHNLPFKRELECII